MKKLLMFFMTLTLVFSLAACGNTGDDEGKPKVMATLFPQYDFARQIAGDYIDLEFVVPPGVSPHTFEPGPQRVIRILEADLLFYTGDAMEPWVPRLIDSDSNNSSLRMVDLSKNVSLIDDNQRIEDGHDHNDNDHNHDGEPVDDEIGEFEILNRRNDDTKIAYVHDNHWHGNLPAIGMGEILSLGANIVSSDDTKRELDPDGEHNGLVVSLHEGAREGLVDLESHGDHVRITGLEEGVTQIVFSWTHDGEIRYTTPPINVTVSGEYDGDNDHSHGVVDPHFWLDPINAKQMVKDVRDALIDILPEHEDELRANTDAYLAELDLLHEDYLHMREHVELDIVMHGGHNAFNYLMKRYDIQYVTPYRGFSTDAEPTPGAIKDMIDKMEEYGIEHLFSEKLVSESVANTISEQTGAEILYIYDAENAPVDEFNAGITYIDMMRHNLEQYKIGLKYNE